MWSTGAPVKRQGWSSEGRRISYLEVLDLAGADLSRLNNGAPFLAQHSVGGLISTGRDALGDVLGVVVEGSARVENGEALATIRFSAREEIAPIVQDIQDGILRNISVGYEPTEWEDRETDTGLIERTITGWLAYELSAVAMGADDTAMFRSFAPTQDPDTNDNSARTAPTQEATMADKTKTDPIVPAAPAVERQPETPAPVPAPVVDLKAVRQEAAADERRRMAGILEAGRKLGIPAADVQRAINDGVSLESARDDFFAAAADADDKPNIQPTHRGAIEPGEQDEVATRSEGMLNALLHRANPSKNKLSEQGMEFRGLRLVEFCRAALVANGISTRGMGQREIARKALSLRGSGMTTRAGYHTTSDFPLLLADAMGKSLRRAYDETPRTFEPWAKRATAPDFKQVKRLQLGSAPNLLLKVENGEVTYGTIGESREQYALGTYARALAITRETIINDDLDAFDQLPAAFGMAASRLESDIVYGILTANANMADGSALFSVAHANISGAAAPPSIATLGAMMTALARQTALDGTTPLNNQGRYVIVPVTLRLVTEQAIGVVQRFPDAPGNISPAYLQSLIPIAEPRLDAVSLTDWYGAGDPNACDTVEYMYLEGDEGVMIETENGFEVDGVKIKATLDFAAKAIDHRNMYLNTTP
mgnify:FL=1